MAATLQINRLSLLEKVVQKIIHTQNETFLAEIEALVENEADDALWHTLSVAEQDYITAAETEADKETNWISDEKARQQINQLLKR